MCRFAYKPSIRQILFIIILVSAAYPVSYGQRKKEVPPPLKERLFFGGNFGLQLGTITDIQVAPVIGLWVLPRIAVAAGPNYRFYKDPYDRTNIYGGKAYTELMLVQDLSSVIPIGNGLGIFIHLEDEFLSLESSFWKSPPYTSERFSLNSVLLGGGISQQIGRRSSINMMALWVLNKPVYDIYGNPEIRVSFNF